MPAIQDLYVQARAARENAYAPYSKFKVGAAVLGYHGKIYRGCNVENISYPCGTCAEESAIAAMIADNTRHIEAILIIADSKPLIRPCGACLQRIAEFALSHTRIYLADPEGIKQEFSLKDLLPSEFKAEELCK